MSRFRTLLIAAGLAAAPISALAAPPASSPSPQTHVERFEWSSGKGRLGVMVMGLTPELRGHFGAATDRGVLVAHVDPNSPAGRAGLQVGDVIVDVKGKAIDGAGDVIGSLADVKKGDSVTVAVIRDHRNVLVHATLDSDPLPQGAWRDMDDMPDLFKDEPGMPSRDWFRSFFDRAWPPAQAPHQQQHQQGQPPTQGST